ncbi:TIGR00159 family protein [bacterium]|nr:TIGR00159 family protein [bacterium]
MTWVLSWHHMAMGLDLAIVFLITYRVLSWISSTHSESLVRGFLAVFALFAVSKVLHFTTLGWLMGWFAQGLMVLIIVIFQPELRRVLERIGSSRWVGNWSSQRPRYQGIAAIKQLLKATERFSQERVGALMVIESGIHLGQYADSGIPIHATITSELLCSLFWGKSPTHDGAVIIRDQSIVAAGCLLPLSNSLIHDRRLGTRHRAALGLSEVSDAIIIVVSEETGIISIAENGNLTRYLTKQALETRLFNLYKEDEPSSPWANVWRKLKTR